MSVPLRELLPIGMLAALLSATAAPALARTGHDYARDVEIVRDDFGIAHIDGKTDADAVFGMIYAQAEDDFPRIERNYLVALGRLSEAEGEAALWQDLRQRLFLDHDALRAAYRDSPAWLKALMDAWAAGLNHYLATHPDTQPLAITRFEPWMTLAFSEGSIGGDIERGVDLDALRAFYEGGAEALPPQEQSFRLVEPKGSNGIAIAPARSVNGNPLLWINPHTSFYFRAEQQMRSDEGLNAYGAATWGQFFIYQGFNPDLGWMHTSSGVDNIDEFAETVALRGDELAYRYGDEWRPVETRIVSIRVRQPDGSMAERRFNALSTHHGPIVGVKDGRWIALALLNAPRAALEQSYLRTKAKTLQEYLQVSERKANSSNNTILAASDGTIAYLHPQFVPVRDDRFDYRHPVDGSDPATDWQGLHDLETLPQAINPGVGWVMNTNNWPYSAAGPDSPSAENFPVYMDQFGENPRGRHALQLLSGDRQFTPQSLTNAAFDSFLPFFDAQIPKLARGMAALPAGDPLRNELAGPFALLRNWDRRWSTTSTPTSLAVHWGEALWASEGPKAAAAGIRIFRYLDERTTDADRVAALVAATETMKEKLGDWRVEWGRINRFQRLSPTIEAEFDDRAPSYPVGFTSGNFGSLASFAVERQDGQKCFYGTSGNSFVAVVEFGPQANAWAVSAGGESGDPTSPHFDDQIPRYAQGDLRRVPLTDADLAPFAGRAYHPGEPKPVPHSREPMAGSSRCGDL
ncbi:acyl-homoserine-lactone acylase [Pacificimonas flava]|nr:penicillin acylase family protein [Pacificimonas flava]MBB5279739.1 acyl-homoserine-lactone acylase [Pacificimonas flava]